jgi:peptide/nickel transport system substrate-binding protein
MRWSRRDVLAFGGLTLAGAMTPSTSLAQAPRRGGTLTVRGWDPPMFDSMLTTAYRVHVPLSLTHSRLVKHKAGPSVVPGTFTIEGDLAESWTQPNDTTYVFKLRKGIRWHPKPPVNGRELTSADVKYTIERFLTIKGNPSAYMLRAVDRVETPDPYTVRIVLKEVNAWFLEMLASPMSVAIVPREAVEKFGDLKKAESAIGTGPWMLDSHRPNVGLTFVRHPQYFQPDLPYIGRIEMVVDEDNASRLSAFLAGKYDLGWDLIGAIPRTDWVQIKDTLKQRRPGLRVAEFVSNVETHISMRTDIKPFNDVRPRGGPAPARRRGLPERIPGEPLLHDLRLARVRGHRTTDPQVSERRRHRHEARPEGVRRVHRELLFRQVRLDDLRPANAVRRSRQLHLRNALPGRAEEPEPRERPGGH